jgi:phage major head subunit gpT-like protein
MRLITAAGIRGEFFLTVERLRAAWLDRLCVRFGSNSASEDYAWLGTPGGLREVKGEKHTEELPEYSLTIRNKEFDGGIEFRRPDIERDKTGQIAMTRTREFAGRVVNHEVELVTDLIAAGTGTTLGKAYDAKNFFAANHLSNKSGVQKNLVTKTTVAPLQVAEPTTPTSTEAVKAILGVIAHILTIRDDQGKPMNSNAREFLVMTSPVLWQYLVPAVVNTTINQGDTNTIVSLKADGFDISVVANPLLTYTVDFDVYRTDAPLKPYAIQEEVPLEFTALGEGTEHWKLNNSILGKAYKRGNVGYARWEYACHATLSQ